ncbi:MAG: hypothetical protein J6112_03650 [Clostridia bacterium]|nr:hypothetical protein [Clostridia bacterium]
MLTEICLYLKNFFSADSDKHIGEFSVSEGKLTPPIYLEDGQYYRIAGSVFNDGVHRSDEVLQDEGPFYGGVWAMRVPQDVIRLSIEMGDWINKYGGTDGPYQSESFGGYTYTKATGATGAPYDVWSAFEKRLAPYKKIRL